MTALAPPSYDLAPLLVLMFLGALLALLPVAWVWRRHRGQGRAARFKALTVLTLFLTFDLVLFGAFTRLTDSGLGCPDWPGCYGNASPLGARADIHAAQTAMPDGPVTHRKAWVEMTHRYLATGVGALITFLMLAAWIGRRRQRWGISPGWATLTFVWVCLQGAFGAWTVTMKLYPAIVTLHLLGGMGLLMLLAAQVQLQVPRPVPLRSGLHAAAWAVLLLTLAQVTLGGWVSTNYAVLACSDFPTCQGQWWPPGDASGFEVLRPLGLSSNGEVLPFTALISIHMLHRAGALLLLPALLLLAWRLWRTGRAELRRWAFGLAMGAVWQLASGLSNVVLGWPLVAALAHTGGAAALLALQAAMLTRVRLAARSGSVAS